MFSTTERSAMNRRRPGRAVVRGWSRLLSGIGMLLVLFATSSVSAQAPGDRHAVLIGGLGGAPAYTDKFSGYLSETRRLLVERADFAAANVYVLAETALSGEPFVDGVSNADNIRSRFGALAQSLTPDDHLYVFMFGHGSYDGSNAALNIPRRDLDDFDYAAMLDRIDAGRTVVINTSSASGPFAEALSAPDRIVITATATGRERDETVFPQYIVEALGSTDADLDRNGGVSVAEVFSYAAQQTARSFEEVGQLATEHAQLEDNADGSPSRLDAVGTADGHLASVTYLVPRPDLAAMRSADRPLLQERDTLERSIAEVKSRKGDMTTDAYYAELEDLFVQLARLNERLEDAP